MKVQSIDRVFDIIELLSSEANGLALSDIAKRISLPVSTVHRLLNSIMKRGYIEKAKGKKGVYKIGLQFIEVSSLYLNNLELKTEAHPLLVELSRRVGHNVFLSTNMDDEVVYIDRIDAVSTLRSYSIIGQRRSLFTAALGKALLFDKTPQELEHFVYSHTLEKKTPYTIIDKRQLIHDINTCKSRGWGYDNQEDQLGFRCVSAPIRDYRGRVIAAISTSWDKDFFGQVDHEKIAEQVVETAHLISQRMGCRYTQ